MNKINHASKPIDRQALLSVLEDIFTAVSASPGQVSLYKMIADNPALKGKRTLIGQAILKQKIIKRIGSKVAGIAGIRCTYQWNRKAGPPSMQMVEDVCKTVIVLTAEMVAKKKQRRADSRSRIPKVKPPQAGATPCVKCRLMHLQDCRAKLFRLGYDCKKVNVNTLSDEIIVGLQGTH